MNLTHTWYHENAENYIARTLDLPMTEAMAPFLNLLPPTGHILDVGCGSGRDTRTMREKGYRVTPLEPCRRMATLAQIVLGDLVDRVQVRAAQDINEVGMYDGIWACASLLHVPQGSQSEVFYKMAAALKPGGVLFCSYKYNAEGPRWRWEGGRPFLDLNIATLASWLQAFGYEPLHLTATHPGWVSAVARKISLRGSSSGVQANHDVHRRDLRSVVRGLGRCQQHPLHLQEGPPPQPGRPPPRLRDDGRPGPLAPGRARPLPDREAHPVQGPAGVAGRGVPVSDPLEAAVQTATAAIAFNLDLQEPQQKIVAVEIRDALQKTAGMLTPAEKKLLLHFLEDYQDRLGRAGCNDFQQKTWRSWLSRGTPGRSRRRSGKSCRRSTRSWTGGMTPKPVR